MAAVFAMLRSTSFYTVRVLHLSQMTPTRMSHEELRSFDRICTPPVRPPGISIAPTHTIVGLPPLKRVAIEGIRTR